MLPYASYLRVYEPIEAVSEADGDEIAGAGGPALGPVVTLDSEQHTALTRAVTSESADVDWGQLGGRYVLRRHDATFVCPVDMPLRSWLSLTTLVDSVGDRNATMFFPQQSLALADEAFLSWRRDHPQAVAHIRQATWGVPRTWFAMVAEDERETYGADRLSSVRYRARIEDAKRRLAGARSVLQRVIDEVDLLDELAQLSAWLEAFDDDSWVELDYAGVAQLLGERLAADQSAREIRRTLTALHRGDFAAAGEAYRLFEERWRAVNAYERAN